MRRDKSWLAGGLLALVGASAACSLEVTPPSYLARTELFSVRHEVERGPLHPERVGPLIAGPEAPIAEILPGDELRLEVVVLDRDGRRLGDDELDTLWVQCGSRSCGDRELSYGDFEIDFGSEYPPDYDLSCDELEDAGEYTLDATCVLGTGDGRFGFEVPALGPNFAPYDYEIVGLTRTGPRWHTFVVVAWGGRSAADCWRARRGDYAELERCDFIHHSVTVGPIWWLFAHAAELGLDLDLDLSTVPAEALIQPANRIPRAPELRVRVDGDERRLGHAPLEPIPVEPGAHIEIELRFDALSQLAQARIEPVASQTSSDAPSAFKLVLERLITRTATSGAIVHDEAGPAIGDSSLAYDVDPAPPPGRSVIWLAYRDGRGASDVLALEFVH